VDDELTHELVAGYALDALEPDEERRFEEHLAHCPRCQEELAALSGTAGALAFAAPSAGPPPELRAHVLDAARAERPNVVALRPRWAYPVAVVAAAASCAAIGLGAWAGVLHSRSGSAGDLTALPLEGASGSLVVTKGGRAALVVSGLPPTPTDKTYEAWVILGHEARPAGLFRTQDGTASIPLSRNVPSGAVVGITLERAGGAPAPTGEPIVTSAPA
jgi:anti-sigma-K factor RskA